jgi:hypothetical protein
MEEGKRLLGRQKYTRVPNNIRRMKEALLFTSFSKQWYSKN